VLLEELVPQPDVEGGGGSFSVAGYGEEFAFLGSRPVGAKRDGEQFAEAVGGGALTACGRQTDDAVFIGEGLQRIAAGNPLASLIGEAHLGVEFRGPSVAEQAANGDLEDGSRLGLTRVAVKEPLRGIVRLRFGETVWVLLGRDLAPFSNWKADI